MQPKQDEAWHTYQDLSARFRVHVCTIYRWFRHRRKFSPTHNTVRIPESSVQEFIAEHWRTNEIKKKA